MSKGTYSFRKISEEVIYGFESVGPKGNIPKQVHFWLMEDELAKIYNVGFGDLDGATGNLNDTAVTNNGDTMKILTAVADIIIAFTDSRPGTFIHIEGSTASRTRLYQIWISRFLREIDRRFIVLGEYDGRWHLFERRQLRCILNQKKIILYIDSNHIV